MIEISIPKAVILHIEEMVACDKFTSLKLNNRARAINDNDLIAGV